MKLPVINARRTCLWCRKVDLLGADRGSIVIECADDHINMVTWDVSELRHAIRLRLDCPDFEEIEE